MKNSLAYCGQVNLIVSTLDKKTFDWPYLFWVTILNALAVAKQ
jgi:hypothetical protein